MFTALELMFTALEYMSIVLELMFIARKHNLQRGIDTSCFWNAEKSFIVCKIVAMNDFSMFLKHKF